MEKIVTKLKEAITFIQNYTPLIDSHMVNFFTSNLWEKHVPSSIKQECNENIIDNVLEIFSYAISGKNISQFRDLNRFVDSVLQMDIAQQESLNVSQLKDILEIDQFDFKRPPLDEFMTKKKSHEVEVLVEMIATLTHHTGVTHVVEIGDGKGYTSSLLAMQHGINVLGLESSEGNIHGAEKRRTKLHKYWNASKYGSMFGSSKTESPYRQSHIQVRRDTNIGLCVQQKYPENWPLYSLGLSGLHTCGDLSPICLHLFQSKANPQPRFLINIGCCYHLLNSSEGHGHDNPSGFPLSSFVKESGFHLSRNARMMSLQAPFKLFHSNKPPPSSLMYRAVLEQLLDDTFGPGNPTEREVGRIGVKCKSFVQYVRKASSSLGCAFPVNDDELEIYYKKFESLEKNLQFYFMLRVVIAPVIEGIILLDRLLYLKEKGIEKSYLVKLFDPVISPRCYGIVAIRDDYHSHNPPPLTNSD